MTGRGVVLDMIATGLLWGVVSSFRLKPARQNLKYLSLIVPIYQALHKTGIHVGSGSERVVEQSGS